MSQNGYPAINVENGRSKMEIIAINYIVMYPTIMSGIRQNCRVLGVNKRQIYPTLGKKESNERTLFLTKRQKYGTMGYEIA